MLKFLKKSILYLVIIQCVFAFGRNDKVLSKSGKNLTFKIFKTNDNDLTLQQILNSDHTFKTSDSFLEKTKPSNTYWVQIDLQKELNTIATDSIWYLRYRQFGYSSIFYRDNTSIKEKKIGRFENQPKRHSVLYSQGIPFNKDYIFNNRFIYLKIQRVAFFENLSSWRFFYYNKQKINLIQDFYSQRDLNILIPIYLFTGICLIMFSLTIMYYTYTKRTEFLFYALYILFLFLYLTPDIFKLYDVFFNGMSLFSYAFFQISQILINLCYILFVMYYLNAKIQYPKLHVALKAIAITLILIVVLDIFCFITKSFTLHIYLLDFERLIMTLFGICGMIYLLCRGKSKLTYFIVIGSFLYMAGALGLLFLQKRIYMVSGAGLEILVFAAGLTYKIQQEYKERLQFQEEAFLNKTRALRAQINPHFIFNSLSSIQSFITSNDRISALKYLSKFSRLTRNILESSIETNVVLTDEIKMLKDYLELESLRFDNAFSYSIDIDDNLNTDIVEVPFMILQPFVENAIIHGLLNKDGNDKKLNIRFKQDLNYLECTINDNGVGREASSRKKIVHKNKSRGLEVTKERLKMLNKTDNNITIIDKKNSSNEPLGTEVIIKINL